MTTVLSLPINQTRNEVPIYTCFPNGPGLLIPSWVTNVPRKTATFFFTFYGLATHLFHSLFSLLALCSLLYCVFLCVCVCVCVSVSESCVYMHAFCFCLLHTHTHAHTFSCPFSPPPPPPPQEYLDPAAGASGDTKDTTVPRSGPSSPPELILHSQSPQQSLVPPPPT